MTRLSLKTEFTTNDLVVNNGTADNANNGDKLRNAFGKLIKSIDRAEANFVELYAVTGADAPADRLVNGSKELVLNVDGDRAWVDFPAAFGHSISVQGTEIGATTNTMALFSSNDVMLSSSALENPKSWTFDKSGTITTPLMLPLSFTAVLDSAHMTRNVALTDTPWQFAVQFQVNPDGTVQTMMDSPFPNPVNPGYVSGDEFTFLEADHGIPGYTFTIILNDVVLPGGAGWTANPAVSQPPAYPSTVKSLGAVKVTADAKSWTFGTGGKLTLPAGGDIVDSFGTSVLGGASFNQSLNSTDQVAFDRVITTNYIQSSQYQIGNAIRMYGSAPVTVAGAATDSVYSFDNWFTSAKLVIQVEGQLDGDLTGVDHTQTCEATIALNYNTDIDPVMSVYGVVHTSPTPLATFTIRRGTGIFAGKVEILAENSQTTNDILVKVQSLQFVSRYD